MPSDAAPLNAPGSCSPEPIGIVSAATGCSFSTAVDTLMSQENPGRNPLNAIQTIRDASGHSMDTTAEDNSTPNINAHDTNTITTTHTPHTETEHAADHDSSTMDQDQNEEDTNGVTHSASESNVRQMRGPVGSGDQQHTGGVPMDSNDTNDADHKDTSDHTSLRRATAGEENDTAPLRSSQEDQTLVRKEATEERDQQEP